MGSFAAQPNMALLSPRMTADNFSPLVSATIISNKTASRYDQSYFFPLYLNSDRLADQANAFEHEARALNLDPRLYAVICDAAGVDPADQAGPDDDFRAATGDLRPSEVKVFDYIYGVLHAPNYREAYAEFLKLDFPRIPYPCVAGGVPRSQQEGRAATPPPPDGARRNRRNAIPLSR